MANGDLYSLFSEEPDALAQAQALAAALRRQRADASFQRGAGNLALLTGDRVLGQYGQAQLAQAARADEGAGQQEGMLAQAGGQRAGRALQRAMAGQQQAFQSGQSALEREARAREAGLNRELERETTGGRMALEALKADRERAAATQKAGGDLRKELSGRPEFKEFQQVAASYAGLKDSAKDTSGAGGVATIFNFMKMLDPGVAVMEGDVNLIRSSGGPAAKYADMYNYVLTGNPLPAKVRKDIIQRADSLFTVRRGAFDKLTGDYRTLAERAGASPEDVVAGSFELEEPAAQPVAAPAQEATSEVVEERRLEDGRVIQRLSDGTKRFKE